MANLSLSPAGDWVSALEGATGNTRVTVAPGNYSSPRAVTLTCQGQLDIEAPERATMDALFDVTSLGLLRFANVDFAWTPASGAVQKFRVYGSSVWLTNCNGMSMAEGGFFFGRSQTTLTLESGATADSAWDWTRATNNRKDNWIYNEGGSFTFLRGAPSAADASRRYRVVIDLESFPVPAFHLAAGSAYLVNFLLRGQNCLNAGLRFCRGMAGDISIFPAVSGECGVQGFGTGILGLNGALVSVNGDNAPCVLRDCDAGIVAADCTLFVADNTLFPNTRQPIEIYKSGLIPLDEPSRLVAIR